MTQIPKSDRSAVGDGAAAAGERARRTVDRSLCGIHLRLPVLALSLLLLLGCQPAGPGPAATPPPGATAETSGTATAGPGSPGTASPGTASPGNGGTNPTSEAPSSPATTGSSTSCADRLSESDLIGQLMMVGVNSSQVSEGQLQVLRDTRAGAVILMGNTTNSVARTKQLTDRLRAGAHQSPGTTLFVATDHEGGVVQRLQGPGFDDIPSAEEQATWSDAELEQAATRWGKQLLEAGVNSPLGPVADVVPASIGRRNEPISANRRGYGSDPDVVSAKVSAVVSGYGEAGAVSSVKHFPGLGRVIGNTDHRTKVVDDTTTRHDPLLSPFRAAVDAKADMVMVATAVYSKIDAEQPAAFSPTVVDGMIRDDMGFTGVVISDDLGVAKQVAYVDAGQRAVLFIRAGGDLVINVDPSTADEMVDAIAAEAKSDPEFARRVDQSAERVLRMKERRGLASC
ncbi:glycoside hydrolase family 3 N-terminal domain-containing protein [Propionibacteriaceae bacterium Y2011]